MLYVFQYSYIRALSYAELGTLVESSGGEYSYFLEGFKPKDRKIRWWTPLPAFLLSWVSIFLLKPSSLAIITLTSAEYIVRIFRIGCFHDEECMGRNKEFLALSYSLQLLSNPKHLLY
ncbi:hypothetical protein Anas_09006 [Armadillidium nasatum]|uniref:Uncharacterized protein n=1 Tax=Armadillidium nasatum TaxID=96803 RepID=A0A5N5TNI1_9CRUS|nr:hypothetical protein Anas_09006 [Armadillidium nasatum]